MPRKRRKHREEEDAPQEKMVVDVDKLRENVKKTLCDVLHMRWVARLVVGDWW